MERRIECVFFDATDTLLRVRGSVGAVYAPVAARFGFQAGVAAIDEAFRAAIRSAPAPCFPGSNPAELSGLEKKWWEDVVRRTFRPLGKIERFEAFFDEVFELFRTTEPWELLPGAQATLAKLSVTRRLGLVSEMDSRLLDVLKAFDLERFLDPVVLATRTGATKRDGSLFTAALHQAGAAPSHAAHVGDSLSNDVAQARALGLTPIYLDPEARNDAPPGTPTIRSLRELPDILDRIEKQPQQT